MTAPDRKTMTRDKFLEVATDGGRIPIEDARFRCPKCKTEQSARDLIQAGAGENLGEVEGFVAFSCVGRFPNADGAGCNWTLGGLFQIHEVEVEVSEGVFRPCFAPVPPEPEQ